MEKFNLGDIVYLLTDEHNDQYMIISITITLDGGKYYTLACRGMHVDCYELEFSKNKNIE